MSTKEIIEVLTKLSNNINEAIKAFQQIETQIKEKEKEAESKIKPPTYEMCVICLKDLLPNNRKKKLDCKHLFHSQCINKWIRVTPTCPLCKSEVKKVPKRFRSRDINPNTSNRINSNRQLLSSMAVPINTTILSLPSVPRILSPRRYSPQPNENNSGGTSRFTAARMYASNYHGPRGYDQTSSFDFML